MGRWLTPFLNVIGGVGLMLFVIPALFSKPAQLRGEQLRSEAEFFKVREL